MKDRVTVQQLYSSQEDSVFWCAMNAYFHINAKDFKGFVWHELRFIYLCYMNTTSKDHGVQI